MGHKQPVSSPDAISAFRALDKRVGEIIMHLPTETRGWLYTNMTKYTSVDQMPHDIQQAIQSAEATRKKKKIITPSRTRRKKTGM